MAIIDGKKVSAEVKERITSEAKVLKQKTGRSPGLAVVLVGDDPASSVYVRNKKKTCQQVDSSRSNIIYPPIQARGNCSRWLRI